MHFLEGKVKFGRAHAKFAAKTIAKMQRRVEHDEKNSEAVRANGEAKDSIKPSDL